MKIINLTIDSRIYTSNAYLLLGDWNAIDDVNTLVDTGRDISILDSIRAINTGVGKKAVDQVIITHNHFDHSGCLPALTGRYSPAVCAFSPGEYINRILRDGEIIDAADRTLEVVHTPGHSHDSVSLYCAADKTLFAGDSPVAIKSPTGTYQSDFVAAMEKLASLDIENIYFGHGPPVLGAGNRIIAASLDNIRQCRITG